ncbi:hypothetical protein AB4Z39_10770 [Mycobacterium adipatum]
MEMADTLPPIGGEVLITWLEALPEQVRPKRKANDPLPQRVVTRLGGPVTRFVDQGTYSIHDFHKSFTEAESQSHQSLSRILALGPPYTCQREVTLDSGLIVQVDRVLVSEGPHWEFYSDTVERFVMTVRVDLRFTASPA